MKLEWVQVTWMLSFPESSIRPGERVSIALSGGADSTALLLLVHEANALPRKALGVGTSAIHVNHSLRGAESDGDEAFARGLCERLGIPLEVVRVDTQARALKNKETIEEAARFLRQEVFQRILREGWADVVLTAHTQDDQAETVLMKLLRGAWLEGLSGIHPVIAMAPGRLLRPLLRTRRADLREFLEERGQPWREDSSNRDESFTRNRIRAELMPRLRQENPSIDGTLANLAELAREEESRWSAEMQRVLPQIVLPGKPVRGGGRANATAPGAAAVSIEVERLRPMDVALRRRVVRAAAKQLGVQLSFDETARILALSGFPPAGEAIAGVGTGRSGKLQLSHGLSAERSLRELRLSVSGDERT